MAEALRLSDCGNPADGAAYPELGGVFSNNGETTSCATTTVAAATATEDGFDDDGYMYDLAIVATTAAAATATTLYSYCNSGSYGNFNSSHTQNV